MFHRGLGKPLEGDREPLEGFEQRNGMMELHLKMSPLESGICLDHGSASFPGSSQDQCHLSRW